MQHAAGRTLYFLALVTLPWVGLGVVRWITGVDTGGGLQPSWAFLALAIATAGWSVLRRRVPAGSLDFPRDWRVAAGLGLIGVLVSGLGLVAAPVPEAAGIVWSRWLRQVAQLLIMGCFVLAPALWTRTPRQWSRTALLLVIGALGQAAYGLLQGVSFYHPNPVYSGLEAVFTSNPSIYSGSEQLYLGDVFRDIPRLRGTMCEPLYLGNFLVMVWPWIGVALLRTRWRVLSTAVILILLLGTWSRGAWLGLLAQGAVWAALALHGRRSGAPRRPVAPGIRAAAVAAAVLLGVVVLGLLFGFDALLLPWQRLQQSFSTQDWSNLTRWYSMQAAWRAFLTSPWVGVGWGQYAWHFAVHADPMGLHSQFDWPMVNNFPLQILCETGVIGFGMFLGVAIALGRSAWRALQRPGAAGRLAAAAVLSVVGVWAQLLTFSQYNLPHIWVAVGLLAAATRARSTQEGP